MFLRWHPLAISLLCHSKNTICLHNIAKYTSVMECYHISCDYKKPLIPAEGTNNFGFLVRVSAILLIGRALSLVRCSWHGCAFIPSRWLWLLDKNNSTRANTCLTLGSTGHIPVICGSSFFPSPPTIPKGAHDSDPPVQHLNVSTVRRAIFTAPPSMQCTISVSVGVQIFMLVQ